MLMFNCKRKDSYLANLNTRTETHGDEVVPVATITLRSEHKNTVLDQFHPDLLESFYAKAKHDKKQMELVNSQLAQQDMFTELKYPKMKPFVWDEKYPGYRIKFIDELAPESDACHVILGDCELTGIKFQMKANGIVMIEYKANCYPTGDDVIWLYSHQGLNVMVTVLPPEADKQQKLAAVN